MIQQKHANARSGTARARGLLLWVNVRTPHEEETALEVLRTNGAHDVHAHDIVAEKLRTTEGSPLLHQSCGNVLRINDPNLRAENSDRSKSRTSAGKKGANMLIEARIHA